MGRYDRTPEERFWEKVTKNTDGCWLWTAAKNKDGYGVFYVAGALVGAHKFSWEIQNGPTRLSVLHTCDTPACVRPDHLFVGTQLDNMRDCAKKKRGPWGERSGRSRLTKEAVRSIREQSANGARDCDLARSYKVDPSTISNIVSRRRWNNLDLKT